MSRTLLFALLSCGLLGFRHGFDYDHLAAITDITGVQRSWREGMRLGLLYALGHAATVAVLGGMVILLGLHLPEGMDAVGERLVGATLIVLSVYVTMAWLRHRRGDATHAGHVPVSRVALLVRGAQWAGWRVRRVWDAEAERPAPFAFRYENSSVFGVGVIHGLGAETPSQLLLFLLAANLGGPALGMVGLWCFVAGLLVMNTLMTASAGGVFAEGRQRPWVQTMATSVTVVYSFAVGTIFLFGLSGRLPALVR